jgi:hypothetical protein
LNEKHPEPARQPALAEAQAMLLARRAALRREREEAGAASTSGDPQQVSTADNQYTIINGAPAASEVCPSSEQLAQIIEGLPAHLGWGSEKLTAVLRAAARRADEKERARQVAAHDWTAVRLPAAEEDPTPRLFSAEGQIPLPPSLGLAILQQEQAAAGRLWLLLRAIDERGRGAVSRETARAAFCAQESELHFCGPRRLRGLLAAGDGLFWTCSGDAIWLRSAARVAHDLGVARFRGQSVAVPLKSLTGGIAQVRAELYACFHSGREAAPVSRQSIARRSGVPARTQRHYDRLSGVKKQANFARGPRLRGAEAEAQAWQRGPACFAWRDAGHRGDTRFLAWQLPNSYHGPHARLGRGRQKRLNRALADLPTKGTAGNGRCRDDDLQRRYFAHARAAAGAFGRVGEQAVYWPDVQPGVWHCLWRTPESGSKG